MEGKIKDSKNIVCTAIRDNSFKSKGRRWQVKPEGSQFENGIWEPFLKRGKKGEFYNFHY